MAGIILKYLTNLLKIGKEQLSLKGPLLRNKVPIKPMLGLTGLGMLFILVRPLLSNKDNPEQEEIESKIFADGKPGEENQYTMQKTLYLMREKENLLKRQEKEKKAQSKEKESSNSQ